MVDVSRFYHVGGTPMALEDCPTEIALQQGRAVRGQEAILERADGSVSPSLLIRHRFVIGQVPSSAWST